MALFHGNFYAESFLASVDLHVILPLPEEGDYAAGAARFGPGVRFPTLYLLHGAYGDGTDWLRRTRLECYAQTRGVAVVMASAHNSFYQDRPWGPAYETFFARELPDMAEAIFPLSARREDRFVAGLSMGGYGALRLALRYPARYGAAASLSGAFDLPRLREILVPMHPMGEAVFGRLGQDGDWDLTAMARQALDRGETPPPLLLSCGTEDYTLEINRAQRRALEDLGLAVTYEEHPGAHDWDYWDTHIQRILQWLPC